MLLLSAKAQKLCLKANLIRTKALLPKAALLDWFAPGLNVERYCETPQKLRRAIQNKRPGMLSVGALLLHDNARPHTARPSTHLLKVFPVLTRNDCNSGATICRQFQF